MTLLLLILAFLVAAVVALPAWPYAKRWGYYPTSACGLVVVAIVTLILIGRL